MNSSPLKRHVAVSFSTEEISLHISLGLVFLGFLGLWGVILVLGGFEEIFGVFVLVFLLFCCCCFGICLFLVLFCGKYPGGSINFCICVALKSPSWEQYSGYPSNSPGAHRSPPCQCCVLPIPWGRRRAAHAFDGTLPTLGSRPALSAAGWLCAP